MQHYFDDLSDALFEDFWQEHLETQYLGVAAGAALLDRVSLEPLPGTAGLSVFWGFQLLRARGHDQSLRKRATAETRWVGGYTR